MISTMRFYFLFFTFYFLNQCSSQTTGSPKMFRENASHNSSANKNDHVYDIKAWSFYAEAPVRSTPLIANGNVFFGNTKGDFFAVNKTTATLIWKFSTGFAINSSAAS